MEASQRVFCRIEKKYRLSEAQYHVLREQLNACMVPDAISHYTPVQSLLRHARLPPDPRIHRKTRIQGKTPGAQLRHRRSRRHGLCRNQEEVPWCRVQAADPDVLCARGRLPDTRNGFGAGGPDRPGKSAGSSPSIIQCPKSSLPTSGKALTDPDDPGFRLTFDSEIRCRTDNLTLSSGTGGELLLEPGERIMEVKAVGGMPLWMSRLLDEQHLYPTSFSKYGTYYTTRLLPRILKGATASA